MFVMQVSWIVYSVMCSIYLYGQLYPPIVKEICDVLCTVCFTAHASVCFLIIAHLNIIAKENLGIVRFISELEFKVYIIYSIIAMPVVIGLQYL
eukprot:Awhi_evm1s4067